MKYISRKFPYVFPDNDPIPTTGEINRHHSLCYASLKPDIRDKAVQHLREWIDESGEIEIIREAIASDPLSWWVDYHFSWGMAVRNTLRMDGLGEREMGVENLDDLWVRLVEKAVEK